MKFNKIKKSADEWFNHYQVHRIQRKKKRIQQKKSSSRKEYVLYLLNEFRKELWKELAVLILVITAALFILTQLFHFASWSAGQISANVIRLMTPETEAVTEAPTIYPETDITLGSTGSMLLHSPFIDSYPDENGEYDFSTIFRYITPYYSKPDFMTCEFEGAFAGEDHIYSGYPLFNTPDILISNLKDSGIDLQMLASNHIYDMGSYGFHRTMDTYQELQADYTGIRQKETDKPYFVKDINGVKVGFINYVYRTTGQGTNLNGIALLEEDWNLVNSFDYDALPEFYKELKKNLQDMRAEDVRFFVVQMHWGIEYQLTESEVQDQIAQELCNMGVNALIGGHPHCEQPIDLLTQTNGNGRMFCIYSEGNALSNQRTYLMDEMPTGHTEDGVVVTLSLHQDTAGIVSITNAEILPTWVYRYSDDSGSKYFIFPLDDVEHLEETTGIPDLKDDARSSYNRTMDELGPGLEKVKKALPITNTPLF